MSPKKRPASLGRRIPKNISARALRGFYVRHLVEQMTAHLENYAALDPERASAYAEKLLETHFKGETVNIEAADAEWCREQIRNAVIRGKGD